MVFYITLIRPSSIRPVAPIQGLNVSYCVFPCPFPASLSFLKGSFFWHGDVPFSNRSLSLLYLAPFSFSFLCFDFFLTNKEITSLQSLVFQPNKQLTLFCFSFLYLCCFSALTLLLPFFPCYLFFIYSPFFSKPNNKCIQETRIIKR